MRVLVVVAHPKPDSFNMSIATTLANALLNSGHQVKFTNLNAVDFESEEVFDPVLPEDEISSHVKVPDYVWRKGKDLRNSDMLIIVHPNWWNGPPAILKGYIDRVFRPGVAFRFDSDGNMTGLLNNIKSAMVITPSNTDLIDERQKYGDALGLFWESLFKMCGVKNYSRDHINVLKTSEKEKVSFINGLVMSMKGWIIHAENKIYASKEFPEA